MPVYERISGVVSLALIGLALYFVLEFPTQTAGLSLFGTPLALAAPRQWLMMILLAGLVMAGADGVIRSHPALASRRLDYLFTFLTLPGLVVVVAARLLELAPNPVSWAVGLVGVGLVLWLTLVAEYKRAWLDLPAYSWPWLWEQFIGYSLALVLFGLIYHSRSRSALSATGVMLVGGMVALALLRRGPEWTGQTWLLAAIMGLGLGQITWAVNYWRIDAFYVGLLLLVLLYVMVGFTRQYLLGSLSRRVLWEFGVVALVVLVVMWRF